MQQTAPTGEAQARAPQSSGLRAWAARRRHTLIVIGIWLLLIGAARVYMRATGLGHGELIAVLSDLFRRPAVGPLIFIGLAALAPILLIPAATLGVLGGLIYGPPLALAYTLIGCNISGSLAYAAGRYASGELGDTAGPGVLARARALLQRNEFVAVIALRLSLLPYDPVNYLIGAARVRWPVFLIANTIGSLPGLIVVVLAGGSLRGGPGALLHSPGLWLGALGFAALLALCAHLVRRKMP